MTVNRSQTSMEHSPDCRYECRYDCPRSTTMIVIMIVNMSQTSKEHSRSTETSNSSGRRSRLQSGDSGISYASKTSHSHRVAGGWIGTWRQSGGGGSGGREGGGERELFCSILDCVLPLQEVVLLQSLPSFSVLCYSHPYRSLLPHNVISPTTFWSSG